MGHLRQWCFLKSPPKSQNRRPVSMESPSGLLLDANRLRIDETPTRFRLVGLRRQCCLVRFGSVLMTHSTEVRGQIRRGFACSTTHREFGSTDLAPTSYSRGQWLQLYLR